MIVLMLKQDRNVQDMVDDKSQWQIIELQKKLFTIVFQEEGLTIRETKFRASHRRLF